MAKRIEDEFSGLMVSRERKRQMRAIRDGLCPIGGCKEKLATLSRCAGHALIRRERQRLKRGVEFGYDSLADRVQNPKASNDALLLDTELMERVKAMGYG